MHIGWSFWSRTSLSMFFCSSKEIKKTDSIMQTQERLPSFQGHIIRWVTWLLSRVGNGWLSSRKQTTIPSNLTLYLTSQTGIDTVEVRVIVPQPLKMELSYDLLCHSWANIQRTKSAHTEVPEDPSSLPHYLQLPRYGSSLDVHQQMNL